MFIEHAYLLSLQNTGRVNTMHTLQKTKQNTEIGNVTQLVE